MLVRENTENRGRDLLLLRMGPDGAVPDSAALEPFLTAEWNEYRAALSPDGRYVAYVSDQEGEDRVYVQDFPVPSGRRSVSPGAGTDPLWAPGGRTLYFRSGTTFFAVDVTTEPSFSVGAPRELFDEPRIWQPDFTSPVPQWDLNPDGTRFILTVVEGDPSDATAVGWRALNDVYIVTDWFIELRERMGEGR